MLTKSEDAEHIHTLTLTLKGALNAEAAKQVFDQLLRRELNGNGAPLTVKEGTEPGTYDADFPVCCFQQDDQYYWGVCRFGVPGPCGPEQIGCPA